MTTIADVSPQLRLTLDGLAVAGGRVPLPLLLEVGQALQMTVRRIALAIEGKPSHHAGRYQSGLAELTELELVGLRKGSAILEIGLATHVPPLEGLDIGLRALDALEDGLVALADDACLPGAWNMGVIEAARHLLDPLDKRGVDALTVSRLGGLQPREAVFRQSDRARVKARLARPLTAGEEVVEGRLMMADFGKQERCRIEPATGQSVTCTFPSELELAVLESIKRHVRAVGGAQRDPSGRIVAIHLSDVQVIDESSTEDRRSFWDDVDLEALSGEQAATPLVLLEDAISDFWPDHVTVDDFLATIGRHQ